MSIVAGAVGAGAIAGSSITSSVASGLSLLTFDSEYIAERQARMRKPPKTLLRGLAAGTVGLGRGIFEGYVLTHSVFLHPVSPRQATLVWEG